MYTCKCFAPVQVQFVVQFQCFAEVLMLTVERLGSCSTRAVFVPLVLPAETDGQTDKVFNYTHILELLHNS